jgi:hypothetical protein
MLTVGLTSCDKLKTALHPGDEGGTAASPAGGGAGPLAILGTFEGEIDLAIADKKEHPPSNTPLALFVKSGKVRVDLPDKLGAQTPLGAKAYAILDSPAKKLYIVSDAQKQVLLVDLSTSGEKLKGLGGPPHVRGGGAGGSAPSGPQTTLTKTGKFDIVAGTKCEKWDVASDHREGEICVAQEGVSWFHIPMTGIPTEHLWAAELFDGNHFPLRFIGYDKDGATETARVEVTKIDRSAPPATEFEYPPTYRVVDIAQMSGAMPGMLGMPGGPGMGMPGGPAMPGGMPMPPRHHAN